MCYSLLWRCWGAWQSHIFLRTTRIRMEIFMLKSPATFLSTISILGIRIPLSLRPLFGYRVIRFLSLEFMPSSGTATMRHSFSSKGFSIP